LHVIRAIIKKGTVMVKTPAINVLTENCPAAINAK